MNFTSFPSFLARFVVLSLILPFWASIPLTAQELQTPAFRKTSLHGGLGFAGLYATGFLNLEQMLTQHPDKKITATFAKVGLGSYGSWTDTGDYLYLQYGFITGKKANHFEMSAGPNFVLKGEMELPIAFSFAYRHQKPAKSFFYRAGLAYPESLFFGMGLAFF